MKWAAQWRMTRTVQSIEPRKKKMKESPAQKGVRYTLTELAQGSERRGGLKHVRAAKVSLHLVHQHESKLVGR